MVCIPKKINVSAGRSGLRVFVVEDDCIRQLHAVATYSIVILNKS